MKETILTSIAAAIIGIVLTYAIFDIGVFSDTSAKELADAIAQRDAALRQADELAAKLKALQPMGKIKSMPEELQSED